MEEPLYERVSLPRGTRRSRSFRRTLAVDLEKAEFVIEYAYYFDYDIQHMYDLEHVWVWVGHDGQVVDAECSSHGQYVNCWRYRPQAEDGTHVAVYCQPRGEPVHAEVAAGPVVRHQKGVAEVVQLRVSGVVVVGDLAAHHSRGRVFTRELLLERLWGYSFFGDERIVDSHIKNLRKKLGGDYIETVRGAGYRAAKENP